MNWMNDKVFAVREKSIECVKHLIQYLGPAWTQQNVMPKILQFLQVPNYLYRMTILFVIQVTIGGNN